MTDNKNKNKKLKVKCPKCKKEFRYYDSEFRPFCCERCKMVDLGKWVTGEYAIPARPEALTDEDMEELSRIKKIEE